MIKKVSKDEFFKVIENLKFKDKDELEARQFGCKNVIDCYKKAKFKRFAEYYLVIDNRTNKILSPIILQRDGFLVFFVTKDLNNKNSLSFIKELKQLANETINRVGSIFVNTIHWYKEAHKLDKLIGFKPLKKVNYYTTYYMERTNG